MNTANTLLNWACQPDFGARSFAYSCLATSRSLFLPYYGLVMGRAAAAALQDGYVFHKEGCNHHSTDGKSRCSTCAAACKSAPCNVRKAHNPRVERAHPKTNIKLINCKQSTVGKSAMIKTSSTYLLYLDKVRLMIQNKIW